MLLALFILPGLGLGKDGVDRSQLLYNQVQQKASHNSYQRKEDLVTQLKDFRIRTIEFDAHSKSAPAGDWLVYHNIKDDSTNCGLLSECYAKVLVFHKSEPDHEVVTIFFDVDGFNERGHSKADFYALIERSFPKGSIVKPADLMAACPSAATLQESITRPGCGWPRLQDLRGKFIFVVTGAPGTPKKLGYDLRKDLVFISCPEIKPEMMTSVPDMVFFNMAGPNPLAQSVRQAGFVSRCYWLNRENDYQKAMNFGCNLLATDMLDPKLYPWTSTSQSDGWPFKIIR